MRVESLSNAFPLSPKFSFSLFRYFKGETGTWRDHVRDVSLKEIFTEGLAEMKHQARLVKEEFQFEPADHIPYGG